MYHPLSLEELAFLTGRSLSAFKREFRVRYAEPPATYLRRRRLKRACELLRRTDLRVADVAYTTGFRDAAAFSKVFARAYGVSPAGVAGGRSALPSPGTLPAPRKPPHQTSDPAHPGSAPAPCRIRPAR